MSRCAVYQAGYWQPLHYYARMLSTDRFVVLTQAQLNRKVGQTTAKIYGKGGVTSLRVPVIGGHRVALDKAMPDYGSGWVNAHLKTLRMVYGKARRFDAVYPSLEMILKAYEGSNVTLAEIGLHQAIWVAWYAGYDGEVVRSLPKEDGMDGSDWMLYLSKANGATTYVCGKVAYDTYLDLPAFQEAGIEVEVQDWVCKEYKQIGEDFVPNLSILDLLMNCTRAEVKEVLRGC